MIRLRYSKNQIFREVECGLSLEGAAQLCCKHINTVKAWDRGREIPECCRRLMRLNAGRVISHKKNWQDFKISHDHIVTPTGESISPQQILLAQALMYGQSQETIQTSSKLLRLARAVAKILVLERR
ncbi:DUF3653 domain-containing protein [Vibrio diazotrophicus]|uniref:DUF3653 domain-containing protein n=1 Tax=Vibrio diazotrophicus TaxID=685 RepID=UPI00142DF529|nr:DUF3653 domain-containing protein [Vibrio diazotrophicus]NIY94256.1 regulator [Vibrio diazotrophicus]